MRQIIPRKKNAWFLPALILRFILFVIARMMYRVEVIGSRHVPQQGPFLLVSNHISYMDVPLLQIACRRYIHFVALEDLFRVWWLGWLLRMMDVVPISSRNPRRAIDQVVKRLKAGEVVCVFPEGRISRTGNLQRLRPGFELMARQAGCRVLPAFVDGIWGSVFSFAGNRFWGKKPLPPRHPVRVNFGAPLDPEPEAVERVRLALLDLGEEAFQRRPSLGGNLAYQALTSLAKKPWKRQLVDTIPQRRELSRAKLLGVALAYSRTIRSRIPDPRVGVVLPPGAGGTIANLAIVFAGKIPVNLNFTAGRAATESSYRRGEVRTVISAVALEKKLPDFAWPETKVDLPTELKSLGKAGILGWIALAFLLPGPLLAAIAGVRRRGGDAEAGLLFTSGSSGEPKGVVLTHRNILGNVEQISATNFLSPEDSFLASLPLFHSFGFTVTLWYPILEGIPMVTVPSPLDARKIGETARDERTSAVFGTPTFFRPYLKKIEKEEFGSVRLAVTGAEKLPADLRREFEGKFDVPIIEGYGLTETSPVVSANLPDPRPTRTGDQQTGGRTGSVGRLFPGLTARLLGEDGQMNSSLTDTGVLLLKGPNVFSGYLADEEQTAGCFRDGWFITGDLVRFDEDGFLFIEGRVSRFSKIGGEMVPHGTVEERIREAMNLSSEEPEVVVTGVRDAQDREVLVALTSTDIDSRQLRDRLRGLGLPNLWIPRRMFRVEKIPVLGTGKLDLKKCQQTAEQLSAGGEGGLEET